jgi:hypothetical protein
MTSNPIWIYTRKRCEHRDQLVRSEALIPKGSSRGYKFQDGAIPIQLLHHIIVIRIRSKPRNSQIWGRRLPQRTNSKNNCLYRTNSRNQLLRRTESRSSPEDDQAGAGTLTKTGRKKSKAIARDRGTSLTRSRGVAEEISLGGGRWAPAPPTEREAAISLSSSCARDAGGETLAAYELSVCVQRRGEATTP